MLKTKDLLLRKGLKVDWLDYLMNDIRFFLRLIKAFKKDKYTLDGLFVYSFSGNILALSKGFLLNILSLNRFEALILKETEQLI